MMLFQFENNMNPELRELRDFLSKESSEEILFTASW